ncbi:MAG: acyl-CoA thioesterase II [Steroidobacteraceae bacterium]
MSDSKNGADPMRELLKILNVERIDKDLFRGTNARNSWTRVYGGQVLGQALMAASMTIDDARPVHSLHAYFMRPGDPQNNIIYQVERDRDGSSFTSRRVVAIQHGQPILNLAASFHIAESGLHHQIAMPDVPAPEKLRAEAELWEEWSDEVPADVRSLFKAPRAIEYRPVAPQRPSAAHATEPRQTIWFRATAPVPKDPALQRAMLTYATDAHLLGTALLPHGAHWLSPRIQVASLDHAVWFHDDVDMEQWLLYAQDSPWSGGARGINRGLVFARSGELLASVAQEGLIRVRTR